MIQLDSPLKVFGCDLTSSMFTLSPTSKGRRTKTKRMPYKVGVGQKSFKAQSEASYLSILGVHTSIYFELADPIMKAKLTSTLLAPITNACTLTPSTANTKKERLEKKMVSTIISSTERVALQSQDFIPTRKVHHNMILTSSINLL